MWILLYCMCLLYIMYIMDNYVEYMNLNLNLNLKCPDHCLCNRALDIPRHMRMQPQSICTQSASCHICKIADCAFAGNAGNTFPPPISKETGIVSDPGMHHGTCVTHVPWCMWGWLTRGGGENVPGACATRNFPYFARGQSGHATENPREMFSRNPEPDLQKQSIVPSLCV